ncbi:hypothetical protein A4244_03590 [Bacillus badius]|nr:hypothetical protein A4244_03590 [Bacillus badius]OCS86159.1 hypothetical protein A6M11_03590 [Bacillus badius]
MGFFLLDVHRFNLYKYIKWMNGLTLPFLKGVFDMRMYEAMNKLFQFNLILVTVLIAIVGVVALVTNRKKEVTFLCSRLQNAGELLLLSVLSTRSFFII